MKIKISHDEITEIICKELKAEIKKSLKLNKKMKRQFVSKKDIKAMDSVYEYYSGHSYLKTQLTSKIFLDKK